ncbi:MAG: hypothetical protein GY841_03440 [FCB group bacterium]|nr:hypothetical protein [FCB group bacterium]
MHLKILLLVAALCFFGGLVAAENGLDLKVRIGDELDVDTIWVGSEASFDFYFENSLELVGFVTYFRIYSPDELVTWTWKEGPYRIDSPADTIWSYATVEEGSRMDLPDVIWDYYGLGLTQLSFDGLSPDTIILAGASAETPHMNTGPMEHNITMRFQASGLSPGEVGTICVDTTRSG